MHQLAFARFDAGDLDAEALLPHAYFELGLRRVRTRSRLRIEAAGL
jgi:hypothetical protein